MNQITTITITKTNRDNFTIIDCVDNNAWRQIIDHVDIHIFAYVHSKLMVPIKLGIYQNDIREETISVCN